MNFSQMLPRSESQVSRAKQLAVGGKRKRCTKGKNCSAACIQADMVCMVDLPWVGPELTKIKSAIMKKASGVAVPPTPPAEEPKAPAATPPAAAPKPPAVTPSQQPPTNAPPHVVKAYKFDEVLVNKVDRREGDTSYTGWADSYDPKTKKLGQGAFGTVVMNPDGTVIKRGIISDTEAQAIAVAGKAGIGPRLIAADIGPNNSVKTSSPVQLKDGRIAMTKIDGKQAELLNGQTINGVTATDAFWKARAGLHKAGIAHNDMHTDNVLIDDKGVGKVVDLGFAQISRKAALSEALGAFHPPTRGTVIPGIGKQKGDWQVRQWATSTADGLLDRSHGPNSSLLARQEMKQKAPVLSQIVENRADVARRMKDMGFNDDEIKTMFVTGIKNKLDTYEKGPWAKLTDAQAQELTNLLYKGI